MSSFFHPALQRVIEEERRNGVARARRAHELNGETMLQLLLLQHIGDMRIIYERKLVSFSFMAASGSFNLAELLYVERNDFLVSCCRIL